MLFVPGSSSRVAGDEPSAFTMKRSYRFWQAELVGKMRLDPSRDHARFQRSVQATSNIGPDVARVIGSPPPASMTTIESLLSCQRRYAMRVPSGDHVGSFFAPGPLVSWRRSVPSARTVKMSPLRVGERGEGEDRLVSLWDQRSRSQAVVGTVRREEPRAHDGHAGRESRGEEADEEEHPGDAHGWCARWSGDDEDMGSHLSMKAQRGRCRVRRASARMSSR